VEDEDEEEIGEEIDAEPAPQQPRRGQNNCQQQAPPPPPPNLAEVMASITTMEAITMAHQKKTSSARSRGSTA
jgi:hypothetical protein